MSVINVRLNLIALGMTIISGLMIARLLSFQFRLDPEIQERLYDIAGASEGQEVEYQPNRGNIYDRDGRVLAVNTLEYRVGISPSAVGPNRETKRQVAKDLARVLDLNEREVLFLLLPDEETGQYPRYVPLKSPVPLEVGAELETLDIPGLVIEPIYRRDYPQEELMLQILGFVNYDSRGYWGVEQHYQAELAGQSRIGVESGLIVDVPEDVIIRDGQDLVLTIDREVQWVTQQALMEYVEAERAEQGAGSTIRGGTILVMNPRTGEILAMVSYPFYTLEEYNELPDLDKPRLNPAIQDTYEPGSIFKIITAAAVLNERIPGLDLDWTFNGPGCQEMAGIIICDWDSKPGFAVPKPGTSFTSCLTLSLNTCTATWLAGDSANRRLGRDFWYEYLREFGFGSSTGIDLYGEESGIVNWPGTGTYNDANFLQTSFGQGISVTPLQMLTAANAIANDGLIMQPFIVQKKIDGTTVYENQPTPISRPIDADTAQRVLGIMRAVVENEGSRAQVEGYSVAGKTGTAQKIGPDNRYSDTLSWASFIGFVPAEDPYISVLIMLDQPQGYWGSQTAAVLFSDLISRLVVLLEIPPDNVRTNIIMDGGDPFGRE